MFDDPRAARSGANDELGAEIVGVLTSEIQPKTQPPLARPHEVREVRLCHCYRKHRTYEAFARCVWRKTVWVVGEGPWVSLSRCVGWRRGWRNHVTVKLHEDEAQARHSLEFIDRTACGGGCSRQHELVRLVIA